MTPLHARVLLSSEENLVLVVVLVLHKIDSFSITDAATVVKTSRKK